MQSILPNQVGITARRAQQPAAPAQADPDLERESGPRRPPHRSQQPGRQRARPAAGRPALRTRITITAQPDGALEIKATSNISGFSNGQNARTAAATVQGLIDLFVEQNLVRRPPRDRPVARSSSTRSCAAARSRCRRPSSAASNSSSASWACCPATARSTTACRRRAPSSPVSSSRSPPARASLNAMRGQLAATPPTIAGVGGDDGGTASGQIAAARGPDQPESRPRLDRVASRHRRRPPADRAAAPLCGAPSGAAAIPAACPIRPTCRCAR